MTRARLLVLAAVLGCQAAAVGAQMRAPAAQADDVARLLSDLGAAIGAGRADGFHALAAPTLPPAEAAIVERELGAGAPQTATVRERARVPNGDEIDVLADVFIGRGREARIATWRISLRPSPGSPSGYVIAGLQEQAALDGLIKLALDETRQFSVHDLTIRSADLTLKMTSGRAFVAESPAGTTALVVRGDGAVEFSPAEPSEQAQMRVVSGLPVLRSRVDSVFVRVNPREFASHVTGLTPIAGPIDPAELARARDLFARLAPQSFNLDLREIGEQGWSLTPSPGNVVIELKSKRLGWLMYAKAPSEAEDVTLVSRATGRILSSYASPERLVSRGPIYDEGADRAYDIERYQLDVTFDPAKFQLSGRGLLLVKVLAEQVSSLAFRLDDALTVTSVTTPGFGRLLAIRIVGQDKVLVTLPGTLPRGEEVVIEIAYNGRLQPPPLDREAMTLGAPPTAIQGTQQPTVDLFQPDPEPLLIYSGRIAWYPRSFVTDYATATMRIAVPAEYSVVASGALVRATVGSPDEAAQLGVKALRSVEYVAAKPARYLGCVIGRLLPVARGRAEVPGAVVDIDVQATPRELNDNRQLLPRIVDIVQLYAKIVGDAPYPNLTVAVADDNLPGGHSPPFLSILREPLATTPFEWRTDVVAFHDYPNFLLAHEIAHQWWGQAVGWQNYHEQWLSEGLAQYFAVLHVQATLGDAAMRAVLATMRASSQAASAHGPISLGYRLGHIESDGRTFRTILYNKSAVVLHMLRRYIGDDAFFAGLRRDHQQHRFQTAGTDDLRAAFEAESHKPLQRFFDRWIRTADVPRLKVTSRLQPDGLSATVRVEQAADPFDLPLTFLVEYANGRTEERTVSVTGSTFEQTLAFTDRAKRVSVKDDLTLAIIN